MSAAELLTWQRIAEPHRRGRFRYLSSDVEDGRPYWLIRGEWTMRRKVVPMRGEQPSYFRRYQMKGWAIYKGGRYLTRRRTLALAKGVAEAHSRGVRLRVLDR